MKCPYAVNRQIVTQTVIEYNSESQEIGSTVCQNITAEFSQCIKGACGAYDSDTKKCVYKG